MAKFYSELDDGLRSFIDAQHLFFVASAPSKGRINLSPKGMDAFRILSNQEVGYLDLTGSGNETAAHILDDGRLTIMFCSFDEKPLILRLYGRGKVVLPEDARYASTISAFDELPGTRQLILLDIESAQSSCGFAVPFYEYRKDREQLIQWAEAKGEQGLVEYRAKRNRESIDGLPTQIPAKE